MDSENTKKNEVEREKEPPEISGKSTPTLRMYGGIKINFQTGSNKFVHVDFKQ